MCDVVFEMINNFGLIAVVSSTNAKSTVSTKFILGHVITMYRSLKVKRVSFNALIIFSRQFL